MIKKIIFPLFLFLVSCNAPDPPANSVKTKSPSKPKVATPKPSPGPWIVKSYVDANGEPTARKYVRLDTDGTFSNSTVSNNYLHTVFLVNKENAGILLHQHKRSNPAEKFTGLVRIKMKNSSGKELEMTSSRGWNKSGGILIEQNNNDYSQFRIFLLQSEGVINVEINDDSSSVYHFDLNAAGFSDAFSQI
ncbi:MAG: hypothetical protein A2X05_00205 [Bacteroidetes bacterium GWE2_41_25]|nr:MAG: hypothetical protein A2X03_04445 [Bacteroidetes bacterium GWA2_40_15]OFX87964.1 MAG: hypothetical protein A2X06_08685 [Bacteroidetes bacterium GWC2_40_22]OFY03230.1 MAG: hypothetical protein A2X05_00205 [Bacteroidetes bacterium GWE2_41_25]OFY58685.1 MAG: hypothetical protein A2X04_13845 [Bacteroidetes bacterium GWF2_41_9]HBH84472.1 hypothetical protein [Bacteroidales bacterium]